MYLEAPESAAPTEPSNGGSNRRSVTTELQIANATPLTVHPKATTTDTNRQCSPLPQSENKVAGFKERICKEEDREMENLRNKRMASRCMKSPTMCRMRGALDDSLTSLKTFPSLSSLGTCPLRRALLPPGFNATTLTCQSA